MKSITYVSLGLLLAFSVSACAMLKSGTKTETNSQVKPEATPQKQTTTSPTVQGDLQVGQASGSYTAKGETVELKYAYAGRETRFGNEAIVILLTDKPIPSDALAEELKSQTLFESEKIKGLEYAIDKDGMWVRFHPGGYQESSSMKIKEYSVEGEIVRGIDDGSAHLNDNYSRNVKFVAAIVK